MFPGLQDSTPDPNSVLCNKKHMHSPTTSISNTERRSRSILNLEVPTLSPAHITKLLSHSPELPWEETISSLATAASF